MRERERERERKRERERDTCRDSVREIRVSKCVVDDGRDRE